MCSMISKIWKDYEHKEGQYQSNVYYHAIFKNLLKYTVWNPLLPRMRVLLQQIGQILNRASVGIVCLMSDKEV